MTPNQYRRMNARGVAPRNDLDTHDVQAYEQADGRGEPPGRVDLVLKLDEPEDRRSHDDRADVDEPARRAVTSLDPQQLHEEQTEGGHVSAVLRCVAADERPRFGLIDDLHLQRPV